MINLLRLHLQAALRSQKPASPDDYRLQQLSAEIQNTNAESRIYQRPDNAQGTDSHR